MSEIQEQTRKILKRKYKIMRQTRSSMRVRVRPSTRKLRKKLISSKKRRTSSLNSSQDLVRQRPHKMKLKAIIKMRLK